MLLRLLTLLPRLLNNFGLGRKPTDAKTPPNGGVFHFSPNFLYFSRPSVAKPAHHDTGRTAQGRFRHSGQNRS
jgi:hypothetical protein